MPKILFPSKWLKANVNVKEGDVVKFLNSGEFDKKQEQWVFKMLVNRTQEEKLFGLNKKNFNAIAKLYGDNSDDWVYKEMKVHIITIESPRTGEEVETIRLYGPEGSSSETEEEEVNPEEELF